MKSMPANLPELPANPGVGNSLPPPVEAPLQAGRLPFLGWKKLGRILPSSDENAWDHFPSSPHVFELNGKLRMYYEGRQPYTLPEGRREYTLRIGMAEASLEDPLIWKRHPANPVMDVGPAGAVDSHWTGYPWIVRVTDRHWHMYYGTWDGTFTARSTYLRRWGTSMAESDDAGITWRRSGRSLINPGRPGACDEHGSGSCSVLKVGDEYWMWYTALYRPSIDFRRISIALAISRDGGHTFEPHPVGAVLSIPPELDATGTTSSKPFVECVGGKFLMWYSCTTRDGRFYRIHYAESPDGVCFRWHREPVLDVTPGGWDSRSTCYPSIVRLPRWTLMYYVGNGRNPTEQLDGIGVAQLDNPA